MPIAAAPDEPAGRGDGTKAHSSFPERTFSAPFLHCSRNRLRPLPRLRAKSWTIILEVPSLAGATSCLGRGHSIRNRIASPSQMDMNLRKLQKMVKDGSLTC